MSTRYSRLYLEAYSNELGAPGPEVIEANVLLKSEGNQRS